MEAWAVGAALVLGVAVGGIYNVGEMELNFCTVNGNNSANGGNGFISGPGRKWGCGR